MSSVIGLADIVDYGADKSGTVEATAFFKDALSALPSGGTIYVPMGNYLLGAVTISTSNIALALHPQAKLTAKIGVNGHLITVNGSGFRMSGGTVDGQKASQSAGDAIRITADDAQLYGVKVINAYAVGIRASGINKFKATGCEVTNSGNIGIFAEATGANLTEISITGCRVDRSGIAAASIAEGGIKVHGVTSTWTISQVNVSNNIVTMPTSPTDVSAICIETWGGVNRASVNGNQTSGGYMGISIDHNNNSAVAGNAVFNPSFAGIEVAHGSCVTVSGNTVNGNGLISDSAILIDGTTPDSHAVVGNTISGVGGNSPGNAIHVSPATSATNIGITGNVITYTAANHAINIAKTTGFSVNGNTINGDGVNSLKGVFVDTSKYGSISGNSISNMTQNGVTVYASTAVTLDYLVVNSNSCYNCNVDFATSLSGSAVLGAHCAFQGNNRGFEFHAGVVAVTTTYTILPQDHAVNCNATTAAFGVTLPTTQIPSGAELSITKTDASVNAVTVTGTVNGAVNPTLPNQWDTMRLRWSGSAWYQW